MLILSKCPYALSMGKRRAGQLAMVLIHPPPFMGQQLSDTFMGQPLSDKPAIDVIPLNFGCQPWAQSTTSSSGSAVPRYFKCRLMNFLRGRFGRFLCLQMAHPVRIT